MSTTICKGCGRTTNSATSNFWHDTESDGETPKEIGVATKCFVAEVDGLPVSGCSKWDFGQRKEKDHV